MLWTDTDTLNVPYMNTPEKQTLYVPIKSPKAETVYKLRLNSQNTCFSDAYKKESAIRFEIPEIYELANIILYLTECSQKTDNHPSHKTYAKRVEQYFYPFKNHPLIKGLNKKCQAADYFDTYYDFRENSLCYRFQEDFLQYDTYYKWLVFSKEEESTLFRNLAYLVQDFATKSNFRAFYQANQAYYDKLIAQQKQYMPIEQMKTWLEQEFPQRIQSYKVVFSPLIDGSHSTQKFYSSDDNFVECLMFINSAEDTASKKQFSEKEKEGLQSGIIFTEIDHNYVNAMTRKHIDIMKTVFSDKTHWATEKGLKGYDSAYRVFNEYMTHALFCLYIQEHYAPKEAKTIIKKRIDLMNWRGYPKFEAFNDILLSKFHKDLSLIHI